MALENSVFPCISAISGVFKLLSVVLPRSLPGILLVYGLFAQNYHFLYLRHPIFALVLCKNPATGDLHIHAPAADLLFSQALVYCALPDQCFAGSAAFEVAPLRRRNGIILDKWGRSFRLCPHSKVCLHAVANTLLKDRCTVDHFTVYIVDVISGPARFFRVVEVRVAADLALLVAEGLPDVIRAALGAYRRFHSLSEAVHCQIESTPDVVGIHMSGGQARQASLVV